MLNYQKIFKKNPYSLIIKQKEQFFSKQLLQLTKFHYKNCKAYKKFLDFINFGFNNDLSLDELPFLTTRIFKDYELISVKKNKIKKVLSSSGTTSSSVSKIFLDSVNSLNQVKVLSKIMSSFIGNKRLPLLIIDSKKTITDRKFFNARGAAILGFSIFGKNITYALDDNMNLNIEIVMNFLKKNNYKVIIFGFTSIIWSYFILKLKEKKIYMKLHNSILIHGGGWKKLENLKISNHKFRKTIKKYCNIIKVHNYYGMVEQTGTIFIECEYENLHASIFSEILIRRTDLSLSRLREKGLVQLMSLIPSSYPGHNILTEDYGEIIGIDDCKCGRLGKYFKIYGRIKKSEVRGCSDAYQ